MDKKEEYWKFAESEQHFNEIQSGIRNIASGWLLAAFGAIALLLKSDGGVSWLVPETVLIAVVSCMATLGLLVLWINDQVVYERLLNSVFLVGVKREFDDATLPPVGLMMLYTRSGKGMSRWMTLFYVVPIVGFCGITVASILWGLEAGDGRVGGQCLELWVQVALLVIQVLAVAWIVLYGRTVSSGNRAKAFNDQKFTDLFEGDSSQRTQRLGDSIARPERRAGLSGVLGSESGGSGV